MEKQLEDVLRSKLVLGKIHSIDEVKGTVEVTYITETGFRNFNIPSVFGGNDSWIRAYPQVGSFVLISETTEKQFPEIVKVFDPSEKTRYLLSQGKNINSDLLDEDSVSPSDRVAVASTVAADELGKIGHPYRQLRAGEIESSSNGKASFWLGKNGELVIKGGLSKLEMDPFRNTIESFSSGHLKLGLDSSLDSFSDQEYFGVVRRPSQRKEIIGTVNSLKNRIEKISKSEISYERLQNTIDFLTTNIFKSKNSFFVAYSSAYSISVDVTKKSKNLDTIIENLIVLKNNLLAYQQSVESLVSFVNTYITFENDSIKTLKELPNNIKTFIEKVQTFIDKGNDPVDNEIENLLTEIGRGSNFLTSKEFPKEIDIILDDINKIISKKIKEIPPGLEVLKERREGIEKQRSEEEQKLEKIDRKYLNPELKLNPEAGSDQLFAKEYRVNISWKKTGEEPSTIYEKVAGHVYDKNGLPSSYASMSRLRSKEIFVTENNLETAIYVDTLGNMTTVLSDDSIQGYSLNAPKGGIKLNAGKEINIKAGENNSNNSINLNGSLEIQVIGNKLVLSCPNGEIELRAQKITFNGNIIQEQATIKKQQVDVTTTTGTTHGNLPIPGATPDQPNVSGT